MKPIHLLKIFLHNTTNTTMNMAEFFQSHHSKVTFPSLHSPFSHFFLSSKMSMPFTSQKSLESCSSSFTKGVGAIQAMVKQCYINKKKQFFWEVEDHALVGSKLSKQEVQSIRTLIFKM